MDNVRGIPLVGPKKAALLLGQFGTLEQVLANADTETVRRALEDLPEVFREALVLREMEGMSYKEIADVTSVSLGTVMSRLARARTRLRESLSVGLGRGH